MNKKHDWIFFVIAGAVVAAFLVVTFFNYERVVPYEEALGYLTFTESETDVTINLNYSGGTVYGYNDGQFKRTGDNIYIIFKRSLFDKWFGKRVDGYAKLVVKKNGDADSGYVLPPVWYIEDIMDPEFRKTPLNGVMEPGD